MARHSTRLKHMEAPSEVIGNDRSINDNDDDDPRPRRKRQQKSAQNNKAGGATKRRGSLKLLAEMPVDVLLEARLDSPVFARREVMFVAV